MRGLYRGVGISINNERTLCPSNSYFASGLKTDKKGDWNKKERKIQRKDIDSYKMREKEKMYI